MENLYSVKDLHSELVEQEVLASGFTSVKLFEELLEAGIDIFYVEYHRFIFNILLCIYKEDKVPDYVEFCDYLNTNNSCDTVDVKVIKEYVGSIIKNGSGSSNLKKRLIRLIELKVKRSMRQNLIEYDKSIDSVVNIEELHSSFEDKSRLILSYIEGGRGKESKTFRECLQENAEKWQSEEQIFPTGFNSLDQIIDGFRPETLNIIAAGTGVGKTALGLNIANNLCKSGHRVLFYSLEMSRYELTNRLVSSIAKIDSRKISNRSHLEDEACLKRYSLALEKTKDYKFDIIENCSMLSEMKRSIKNNHAENSDLKVVFIDYLQLMRCSAKENRLAEITAISRDLKLLAQELGIAIVAMAQLNNKRFERQDKRPIVEDIRECSSVAMDSNVVILLNREKSSEHTILDVAKNRHGTTGEINLTFDGPLTTFKESLY